MTKLRTWKYLLPLIAAPCWGSGILTVNLNPLDGALTGTPGGAVVWGVQAINSDANDWLLITRVRAPGYGGTDAPNLFTDYLSVYFFNNFTALGLGMAPGQVIDVGFSSGTPTVGDPNTTGLGLGSLAISPSAGDGELQPENIQIFYDIYDGDLFNGGNRLFPSQETDVLTSVTVDSGAVLPLHRSPATANGSHGSGGALDGTAKTAGGTCGSTGDLLSAAEKLAKLFGHVLRASIHHSMNRCISGVYTPEPPLATASAQRKSRGHTLPKHHQSSVAPLRRQDSSSM